MRLWTNEDEAVKYAAMEETDEDPVEAVCKMKEVIAQQRQMHSIEQQAALGRFQQRDIPRGGMARGRGRWNFGIPLGRGREDRWGDDDGWEDGHDPWMDCGLQWQNYGPFDDHDPGRWDEPDHGNRWRDPEAYEIPDAGGGWMDKPSLGNQFQNRVMFSHRGSFDSRHGRPSFRRSRGTRPGDRTLEPFHQDPDSSNVSRGFRRNEGWSRPPGQGLRGRGGRGAARTEGPFNPPTSTHHVTPSSGLRPRATVSRQQAPPRTPVTYQNVTSSTPVAPAPRFPSAPNPSPFSSQTNPQLTSTIPQAPGYVVDPTTGIYYPSTNQSQTGLPSASQNQASLLSTNKSQAQPTASDYQPVGFDYYLGGVSYQNYAGVSASGFLPSASQSDTLSSYAAYNADSSGSVYGQGSYGSY